MKIVSAFSCVVIRNFVFLNWRTFIVAAFYTLLLYQGIKDAMIKDSPINMPNLLKLKLYALLTATVLALHEFLIE